MKSLKKVADPATLIEAFYKYVQKQEGESVYVMFMIRVAPDIRPFLISDIMPDIRFHLPDIRLAGYPARKTLYCILFLQNLGPH